MKKLFLMIPALLLLIPVCAFAQSTERTAVRATITVEKQVIRTGPYARFAQKYLGVIAPLADKQIVAVTGATLSAVQQGAAVAAPAPMAHCGGHEGVTLMSHTHNRFDFVKVPVDKMDATVRSLEESAKEAANKIFALRKARLELVTGMAGENVFDSGLKAALDEIDRLEEEFLSLFMGKQTVQQMTRTYDIVPEAGETSRVVCRFSDTDGLLPESDLTGSPIMLDMKVAEKPAAPAPVAKPSKNAPATVAQWIPAQVTCRLVEGKNELASARLPVYQMGVLAEIPVANAAR